MFLAEANYGPNNPGEAIVAFASLVVMLVVYHLLTRGKKRSRNPKKSAWRLDQVLLRFSKHDNFTLADACQGVLCLGTTGSGKSSAVGRAFALSYLRAGFGGLVLTVKPDERAVWESYCRATGRSRDLFVFSPSKPLRFNVLDFELTRSGNGAGITENIVQLFCELLQVTERQSGQGSRDSEPYWTRATRQLLRNVIDLLVMANGRLSVPDLYRAVISAPSSLKEVSSESWQKSSFYYRCLQEADARQKTPAQARDFEIVADFFCTEWPALSEKTRSVVQSTFTSMIDVINRGMLRDLFCGETNITPEAIENGAVVVIDLPVKEYAEVGQIAQVIWKLAFQRSIERRNLAANDRPVFLWMDEASFFTTAGDFGFQSTCRGARVATMLITQSIANFYSALGGGDAGRVQADSLLANLVTKIACCLGDSATAEWMANLLGRSRQLFVNSSSGYQPADFTGGRALAHCNAGVSEQVDFDVPPQKLLSLRNGGPANKWEVQTIVTQGTRRFRKTGRTWMNVSFSQR